MSRLSRNAPPGPLANPHSDVCPRISANSCVHVRFFRSRSFTLYIYRALLASLGLSVFLLSTTTIEDTTELWGVTDYVSSPSIGDTPRCLLLLLIELFLESFLPPKRLVKDLAAKKGGNGDGPKVNRPVSSKATPFSHSVPVGLSKWMPSEDASSGRECSIILATSSSLTGSTLLCWIF